ncbi:hypothetical protein Y032_0138g2057 [Ancylostoma ceylanicum]|uniref:Uncharacterized protein n=1 Tax=Ancylostoma ceylanicum TaxID=53326 RepID=A0A016T4S6_9BILA|nr:hypothetical protein Y032_0138g2057 [Ancylostoma ceylanicum]
MDILDPHIDLPQRFTFLPTDDDRSQVQSASQSLVIARFLLVAEFAISLSFDIVLFYAIRHGQYLSLLLCIIASLNCIAAATLLSSKRPFHSASAIAVFVIWKVFQEVVLVPVLVIFTFLMAEGFIDTWITPLTAHGVLAIVWIYAIYSMATILYLGQVARNLWKTKARKRRSSLTSISTVTRSFELPLDSEIQSTSSLSLRNT